MVETLQSPRGYVGIRWRPEVQLPGGQVGGGVELHLNDIVDLH